MPHSRRIRQIQVRPATGADLHIELQLLVAVGALPFWFVLLHSVEHDRDQTEQRDDGANHEPDPKRGALAPGDKASGETEEEGDDEVLHQVILALLRAGLRLSRR